MSNKDSILSLAKKELPQLKAIIRLSSPKGTDVETMALQELEYLQMIGLSNPVIYECLPETIVAAIKTTLKQNLTLDPYAGLVYVKTRGVKVGVDANGKDIWKKALEIQPSANGLISLARQSSRILDVERPQIIKDSTGKVIGSKVKFLVPSFDDKGRRSTRWHEVEFDETDFSRWRRSSHKENSRNKSDAATRDYSNENYSNWKGGPDPSFIRSKTIRHGLKLLGINVNEPARVQASAFPFENNIEVDTDKDKQAADEDYINHEPINETNNSNGKAHIDINGEIPTSDQL